MTDYPCFWLDHTDTAKIGLRRYVESAHDGYTCETGWHATIAYIGEAHINRDADGMYRNQSIEFDWPGHDDERWPRTCHLCGHPYAESDNWQDWSDPLLRRSDTGEMMTMRDAAPGAMWDAFWMHGFRPGSFGGWKNYDGKIVQVKLPDMTTWTIDSRASNCTMPEDTEHRCWCRHGDVPMLTVDKSCQTCQAGGGSIQSSDYHGFLRNGILVPC